MSSSILSFELSCVVDKDKLDRILEKVSENNYQLYEADFGFVDESYISKGIGVEYHYDSRKKKIKMIVNPSALLKNGDSLWKPTDKNATKLCDKLDQFMGMYCDDCSLNDFRMTSVSLAADIEVGNPARVSDYIKVLHNMGKIKGFSPIKYSKRGGGINKDSAFVLVGNSVDIEFMAYSKDAMSGDDDTTSKKLRMKHYNDVLRVEVRLTSHDAICKCTDETKTSKQLKGLSAISEDMFMAVFERIVPRGNYYKKNHAQKLIKDGIPDRRLREKMLRLLELIPAKKSLLLAQKALNIRDIHDIMKKFSDINVSPITLSKRQNINNLDSLYSFIDD